jgi:hypothetical protein
MTDEVMRYGWYACSNSIAHINCVARRIITTLANAFSAAGTRSMCAPRARSDKKKMTRDLGLIPYLPDVTLLDGGDGERSARRAH